VEFERLAAGALSRGASKWRSNKLASCAYLLLRIVGRLPCCLHIQRRTRTLIFTRYPLLGTAHLRAVCSRVFALTPRIAASAATRAFTRSSFSGKILGGGDDSGFYRNGEQRRDLIGRNMVVAGIIDGST